MMNSKKNKIIGDKTTNNNFTEDDLNYINQFEQIDSSGEDDVFFNLFQNLLSTIVVADKISSIMKKTMDEVSEDIIIESTDELSKKLKQRITTYNKISKEINDIVMLIHNFSGEENYFWKDCPVEVYISHHNLIKKNYIEKFVYANEIDFLMYEYQYYLNEDDIETNVAHGEFRDNDYLSLLNYKKYLTYQNKQFFSLLNKRKIEFLKSEIDNLSCNVEISVIGGIQKVNVIENSIPKAEDLSLSGLPKFNVQQRYELFKKLGFEKTIHTIKTEKQMSKYKILGIVLGINPDNAKQLFNGTYRGLTEKDENALAEYLISQGVKI